MSGTQSTPAVASPTLDPEIEASIERDAQKDRDELIGECMHRFAREAADRRDFEAAERDERAAIHFKRQAALKRVRALRARLAQTRARIAKPAAISTVAPKPARDHAGRFASSDDSKRRRKPVRKAKAATTSSTEDEQPPPPPPRPCYCPHCLPLPDDWAGPEWVRCLFCGHDVKETAS